VLVLELDGRDEPDLSVEAAVVEPVDVLRDRDLEVIDAAPRTQDTVMASAPSMVALWTLARRAHAMLKEALDLQKALVAIIRSWRPDLLEEFGVGPIVAATVWCACPTPAVFTPVTDP